MKHLTTVNIHSFIDVITNSSTELFICSSDKTLELISEILDSSGISGYLPPFFFSYDEFKKYENNYDEPHSEPHSKLGGWFYDDKDPDVKNILRKDFILHEPWGYDKGYWRDELKKIVYHERDDIVKKVFDEISNGKKPEPYWWDDPEEYESANPVSSLTDKIIILSDGDNAMPYEDWGKIESIFNAERQHLG